MEMKEIKTLMKQFFEGSTTLKEERMLRNYFSNSENIPDEYHQYRPLFAYYQKAQEDKFPKKKRSKTTSFWYAAAAASVALIIYFTIPIPTQNPNTLSATEQEAALAVYQEFKANLITVSSHYNKGAEKIAYLDYWNQTTEKLIK